MDLLLDRLLPSKNLNNKTMDVKDSSTVTERENRKITHYKNHGVESDPKDGLVILTTNRIAVRRIIDE
jgi:hypothetical protein